MQFGLPLVYGPILLVRFALAKGLPVARDVIIGLFVMAAQLVILGFPIPHPPDAFPRRMRYIHGDAAWSVTGAPPPGFEEISRWR